MKQILAITRKELDGYFGSLLSAIFLGAFLAIVLFIFFTIETFFARGIADIRPLFKWMPVLLIFLMSALTMRLWSEEQRSGTQEILLTLPVKPVQLVLGKFLAVMVMISLALLMTVPLPLSISLLGNLDWGPVIGGYLAALLMSTAYAAIGLFVSSRTDNQIVSLIITVLLCGAFYLVGTNGITDFFGGNISRILWALGTGSRFESIQRGVIDLRDLVYYLSLAGIFLTLNVLSLNSKRWSASQTAYRYGQILTSVLVIANLVLVNVWAYPLNNLRLDLTQNREYTISKVTKDLLGQLNEPLLIRAYLSNKTHPLLAPLVPQVEDMLREYAIAGNGKVVAEAIDPAEHPDLEVEANQTYGIKPTPFQVSGRYEASVINSYFSILLRYGDQSMVLNFSDLIEIQQGNNDATVRLRNLEYDLTRAIKKVVYGFQSLDSVLAALTEPARLVLFVTPDLLPQDYNEVNALVQQVGADIQAKSNGKLNFAVVNPDDPEATVTRKTLIEQGGIQPFPLSLFSPESFFFHLVLTSSEKTELIYPQPGMTDAEIRGMVESSLKRTSTGFLKRVGVAGPSEQPKQTETGQTVQAIETYQTIRQQLSQEYSVLNVNLSAGSVPANVDVLLLLSPQGYTDVELYAIDQYLMRGGAVIMLTNPFKLDVDYGLGQLVMVSIDDGVAGLLEHYGVQIGKQLVMDERNQPFPITVRRNVNGTEIPELRALSYPFFIDIRPDKMSKDNPIVSGIPTITLNWASPITLDTAKTANLQPAVLLSSSDRSWLAADSHIQPDMDTYPDVGFPAGTNFSSSALGVALQGEFSSYFIGKPLPDLAAAEAAQQAKMMGAPVPTPAPTSAAPSGPVTMLEKSPATSRLVVISSSAFMTDFVMQLSAQVSQNAYLNSLQLVQNAVDWSVEDMDLLSIRAGGASVRVLQPLNEQQQRTVEFGNYLIALVLLLSIVLYWQYRIKHEPAMKLVTASTKPAGKADEHTERGA